MNDLQYYALQYADYGLSVIPLKKDKSPYTPNGLKNASKDPDQINAWWSKWPTANIGIVTGSVSGGIFVVDQDEKDGAHGIEEFGKWIDDNFLAFGDTWTVRTGSGGKHTYFRSKQQIGNRVGWLPGVDIRAENAYVVAPPSINADGKPYEWLVSPSDVFQPISEDEDSDVYFLAESIQTKPASTTFSAPETVITGHRNDTLYKMACSLQAKGLSDDAIMAAVSAENQAKCQPPLEDDEIRKLVQSALTKQKGQASPEESPEENTTTTKFDFPLTGLRSVKELMAQEDDPLVVYVGDEKTPLLSEGTTVLAAPPKLGKSWFCLNLCQALHDGTPFLGFPTKKTHMVYYDLEQSERLERKRISQMAKELGIDYPEGFYIKNELQRIAHGFVEQLELDMKNDPEIGVFIIDVFTNVEQARKTTETEYQWVYKNFNIINSLAKRHHVSVILVMHTRKVRDPEHPFDNILGSSANQGASNHMIVLDKEKFNSPTIHLYAQGRETEGVIELDYENDKGVLKLTEVQPEEPEGLNEFMESEIRKAIVEFMQTNVKWKGRCSGLIEDMVKSGIGIDADPKELGGFLSHNMGRFLKHDGLTIDITKNGTGGRTYTISQSTVDTVDEEWLTVDETML